MRGGPCLLLSCSSNLNFGQHFPWTAPCLSSPCMLVVGISQLTLHFQIPVVISLRCKLDVVVLRLKNPLIRPPPMKSKWLPMGPKDLQDLPCLHLYAHSRGALPTLWCPPSGKFTCQITTYLSLKTESVGREAWMWISPERVCSLLLLRVHLMGLSTLSCSPWLLSHLVTLSLSSC